MKIELTKYNEDYNVCILWDKGHTHYFVALTCSDYSVTLDMDDIVCVLEEKSQSLFWGKSSGWSIPTKNIEIIKKSNLDTYLRGKGIHSIEELLGTSHSRRLAVAEATELAFASRRLG